MTQQTTIEIFRAGTHTPMKGAAIFFSETDLATTATAYDTGKHEAPLVIGHPKADAPAYGWAKRLEVKDAKLLAHVGDIAPAFAEAVRRGHYRKISAAFYTPDGPNNPTPGKYYLRHIGVLGAQPPAVKGLAPIELADGENGVVEFGESGDAAADLSAREKAVAFSERRIEIDDFVREGRILPRERDFVLAFMASLNNADTIEFGEGEARTQCGQVEAFRRLIRERPPLVNFAEITGGRNNIPDSVFAELGGMPVNEQRLEIHRLAVAYQKQNGCSYVEAVRAVAAYCPER